MPGMDNNELSERELEILRLIATGASNKEVAQKLCISANTVKVHLRNIYSKAGVTSRTEAAMYAVRLGLVQASEGGDDHETMTSPEGSSMGIDQENNVLANAGEEADQGSLDTFRSKQNRYGWIVAGAFLLVLLFSFGVFFFRQPATSTAGVQFPAPTSSHWHDLSPLPTARQGLASVEYDNKVYAIAGETSHSVTGAVEQFDPQANSWTVRQVKPIPVADISAVVIGGLIYVPGGRTASGKPTNILEVYDPRQDHWEQKAPLPKAISAYGLAAFEGHLYLFGGWDGNAYLNSVYSYDPSRDAWASLSPMPTARGFSGAATANGKIYVLGGFNGTRALNVNEVYLPEGSNEGENAWNEAEPMPGSRYAMGVTSIADSIYVVGGEGGKNSLPSIVYFSQSNTWQNFDSPSPLPWSRLGLVTLGSHLSLFGGQLDRQLTQKNLDFQAIYTISMPIIQ